MRVGMKRGWNKTSAVTNHCLQKYKTFNNTNSKTPCCICTWVQYYKYLKWWVTGTLAIPVNSTVSGSLLSDSEGFKWTERTSLRKGGEWERERGRRGSEREGKQCFISSFNFLLKRDTCKLEPDGRSVRDLLNTGMNVLPGDMVLVILPPTLHWLL